MTSLLPRLAAATLAGVLVSAAAPTTALAQFYYQPPIHRPLNYFLNLHRPFAPYAYPAGRASATSRGPITRTMWPW
jgi:hypothetical protein